MKRTNASGSGIPPRSDLVQRLCMAETAYPRHRDVPVVCNAETGHDGPHAAYAGPGNLVHSWPQGGDRS